MDRERAIPVLDIELLGGFRLAYGGELVTSVDAPRLRALLACAAVAASLRVRLPAASHEARSRTGVSPHPARNRGRRARPSCAAPYARALAAALTLRGLGVGCYPW